MSLRNQCQAWVKLGCHKAPMALRAATVLILLTAWWDPHLSSTSAARKRWRRCEKEQGFYSVLMVCNRHLKGTSRVLWWFQHRLALVCDMKWLWEVWCVAPSLLLLCSMLIDETEDHPLHLMVAWLALVDSRGTCWWKVVMMRFFKLQNHWMLWFKGTLWHFYSSLLFRSHPVRAGC